MALCAHLFGAIAHSAVPEAIAIRQQSRYANLFDVSGIQHQEETPSLSAAAVVLRDQVSCPCCYFPTYQKRSFVSAQ